MDKATLKEVLHWLETTHISGDTDADIGHYYRYSREDIIRHIRRILGN